MDLGVEEELSAGVCLFVFYHCGEEASELVTSGQAATRTSGVSACSLMNTPQSQRRETEVIVFLDVYEFLEVMEKECLPVSSGHNLMIFSMDKLSDITRCEANCSNLSHAVYFGAFEGVLEKHQLGLNLLGPQPGKSR